MLVRDPNTGLLHKTTDDSWPRCSCGRCVYEDMEFPIYYGTGTDDPHVIAHVERFSAAHPDADREGRVESALTLGLGTDRCFECGQVFLAKTKSWVTWEEPDIGFEVTHYYRPMIARELRDDGWRSVLFATREVGTEGPFFSEFDTWREMSADHMADHVRTGWAVPLAEAVPVRRGSTLWMAVDGSLWLSPTDDPVDATGLAGGQDIEMP